MRRAPALLSLVALLGGELSSGPNAQAEDQALALTAPEPMAPWAANLSPIVVRNVNTTVSSELRLYAADGAIDEEAARAVDHVLSDPKAEKQDRAIDRR